MSAETYLKIMAALGIAEATFENRLNLDSGRDCTESFIKEHLPKIREAKTVLESEWKRGEA